MKALVCERFGPLKDLRIKDIPVPVPGPDQVVVQVKAASLNFPDVLICRGEYQVKPTLPFSPGAEMAGIVCAVGENVVDFRPGDRVMASTGYGALAQYCLADAWRLIPIPNDLSFEHAATLIVTYGTALHALQSCGRLRVGETLLVLGVFCRKSIFLRALGCAEGHLLRANFDVEGAGYGANRRARR